MRRSRWVQSSRAKVPPIGVDTPGGALPPTSKREQLQPLGLRIPQLHTHPSLAYVAHATPHSNWMGTMRERHLEGRRRAQMDRRSGKERRWGERRSSIPNPTAAFEGKEFRKSERRSGKERRVAVPPVGAPSG